MKSRKKDNIRRRLAACMVLVIVFALLPAHALAGYFETFIVELDSKINFGSVLVTLTEKDPPYYSQTTSVGGGKAAFDAFNTVGVDDTKTYKLGLKNMKNYIDCELEITPTSAIYTVDPVAENMTSRPVVSTPTKTPSGEWANDDVVVSVPANGNGKDIKEVWYSTNPGHYDAGLNEGAVDTPSSGTVEDGVYEFTVPKATVNTTYYVWAVDEDDNKSLCESIPVKIDATLPEVTGLKIEETQGSQILNFLLFGIFSNNTVKVTVDATDAGGSGVGKITLYYKDSVSVNPQTMEQTTAAQAVFELKLSDLAGGAPYEIWATATDNAGNESAEKRPTSFAGDAQNDWLTLEDTAPEIKIEPQTPDYDGDGNYWYDSDAIDFDVKVQDEDSGLYSVVAKVNGVGVLDENVEVDWGNVKIITQKTFSLNTGALTDDGEIKIEVTATDNAGNEDTVYQSLYVDRTEPDITDFEMEAGDSSAPMGERNFLTYGTFFNGKVMLTVTAADEDGSGGDGVGIDEISLLYPNNMVLMGPVEATDGKAVFELPAGAISGEDIWFEEELIAKAVDYLGHEMSGTVSPTDVSTQINSDQLMIETVKPTIGIAADTPIYTDASGKNWYNGPVDFDVAIDDNTDGSGIRSVEIWLNGQLITSDASTPPRPISTSFYLAQTFHQDFVINTNQGVRAEDGAYKLDVKVTDNAGNIKEAVHTVYVDTEAPVVAGFEFEAAGVVQDLNRQDISMDKTDYGYYFKEETRVTVIAQDRAPGSGVKAISYYTVDINGNKSVVTTVQTAERVTFVLPANFRGQVFAKAADCVGYIQSDFVSPNSVIMESPEKHQEEAHIRFERASTQYTDNNGLKLYAGDTTVGLAVTDTYSGLRRVEWAVTAPYDTGRNFRGSIDVAGKTMTGDTSGWNISQTEKNLVTEMTGAITVRNNSNAIVVWVKITDRAGNVSEESITFSIDKTPPTISVTYDNNNQDRDFSGFYRSDRTATIVVTERNFRPQDVIISITNTDGTIPAVSGWTTAWNAADPDKTTHTATIRYTADGDYTFDIRYSDNAGNAAAPFGQHAFTIDKTVPRISVTYDNNDPVNGMYYPVSRTATITITEHNFETGRVQITGTATDDGVQTVFPAASSWSSRGDVHSATIAYMEDARYTFTIAYTDKAGNQAADFAAHEFVVDQTAPTVEITGVADQSANNGDVIPIVRFSDTNYAPDTVSIALTGAVRHDVPPEGNMANEHNGQVYTFDNFKREKEIDDIYTLSAQLTDLAGNQTSQTIMFSVNRFGSVYAFDTALQAIGGKYIQNEVDVIITETNVDMLRHDDINVKLTYNGVPKDLTEQKEYTVSHTGGNGMWSQYEYKIPKTMFAGEGSYVVTLYSVDSAGNVNENIQESKKAEITFGIDKTPPAIVSIGVESEEQYPMEELRAAVSVTDNLVLKDVNIFLNGEAIETQALENQEFVIPASNTKQSIKIVAVDAAGNESTLEVNDFLVTTSLFYRWLNNTPLFIGTLAAVGGLVFLVIFLIRRAKARVQF